MQTRDPTTAGSQVEWRTQCRDCGRVLGTGTAWTTAAFLVVFAVAVWCLVWGPPFLGAVLMIGAFTGLLWSAGAAVGSRIIRWMSMGR